MGELSYVEKYPGGTWGSWYGFFDYGILWAVTPWTDGWIVQEVFWQFTIRDVGNPVPWSDDRLKSYLGSLYTGPEDRLHYWEAWQVQSAVPHLTPVDSDIFSHTKPFPNTVGIITVVGSASFYEGLDLDSTGTWMPDRPPANALRSILGNEPPPVLPLNQREIVRTLTATWDSSDPVLRQTKVEVVTQINGAI